MGMRYKNDIHQTFYMDLTDREDLEEYLPTGLSVDDEGDMILLKQFIDWYGDKYIRPNSFEDKWDHFIDIKSSECEEKTEVKTFIVKNVTSHYTKDELIKKFPKLSNPTVMKEFTSRKMFGEVCGDTMYVETSGILDDDKWEMFYSLSEKNDPWITELFNYDEGILEKEVDILDLEVKQKQNTKVLNKWTK